MKIATEALLTDLVERTRQNLNKAEKLKLLSFEELSWKSGTGKWSILECIEHLNLYGDFYLEEIENKISQSNTKPDPYFVSGLLGNYFAKSMLPREKLNKMKTFKDKDPSGSALDVSTFDRFIDQQKKTLELLHKARQINITTTKTSISISKLIKLRLGDTFRVVIYHNQRHLVQADKVIAEYRNAVAGASVSLVP